MVWEHPGCCQRSCHLPVPYWGLGWDGLGWVGLGWIGLGWGWVGLDWVAVDVGVGLAGFFQAGYYSVRATISDSGHEFFRFPSGSAVRQNILLVIVLSQEDFCRVRWPE